MAARRLILLTLLVPSLALFGVPPPKDLESTLPRRIMLNLTAKPSTSMDVAWMTTTVTDAQVVQFAPSLNWTDFTSSVRQSPGIEDSAVPTSESPGHHYRATMDSLSPGSSYLFRVGSPDGWSEWNQFETADAEAVPFTILMFGDLQHGMTTFTPRLLRTAFAMCPDARFWLTTGDLIDRPQYDSLWSEFFFAADFMPRMLPSILAAGNHEYPDKKESGKEVRTLSHEWRQHVSLPSNGIPGLEETCYVVDYQGVRFIVLDGNTRLPEQAFWLDRILTENPCTWTIIALHQPIFSVGKNRDQRSTREAFMSLFDKHAVDLVLQGHDHVYARSKKLHDGKVVSETERGTIYLVSVAGSDGYPLNPLYSGLMERTLTEAQLFQSVTVDAMKLSVTAFSVTGRVVDTFEITK